MRENHIRQNSCAVLAALIWGTAFVAQSVGAEHVEAFTFSAARSFVGFLAMLIVCIIMRRLDRGESSRKAPEESGQQYRKDLLAGGCLCGLALAVATNLQQKGLETTSSGKAGFITALYIVIVPIFGIFLKKKIPWTVWVSVAIAVVGLYCLCVQDGFSIAKGDFYIVLCSFCYSAQILLIDHYGERVRGVELSCAQLLVVTIFSTVGMLLMETPSWFAIKVAMFPILYVGIFSSGIAYTLQILAQKGSNPTVVSLLLSLESVFATIGGAVILKDRMSGREYFGCILMLGAVVLAQLPTSGGKKQEI